MAKQSQKREDPRRAFLIKALASGLFAMGGVWAPVTNSQAQFFGRRPGQLPPGQSVYQVRGPALINGEAATRDSTVFADSVIETGSRAEFIFVVGTDAFLVRENSRIEFQGEGGLVSAFQVVTGAILSVFGRGEKNIQVTNGTIGIRGTGIYLESEPDQAYVCTCYGRVQIAIADDPGITETIVSRHHDDPRYLLGPGAEQRIVPAPFINHDDLELMLIESLVGRTPPFSLFDEGYGGPRRY